MRVADVRIYLGVITKSRYESSADMLTLNRRPVLSPLATTGPNTLTSPHERDAYTAALVQQTSTQLVAMIASEAFQAAVLHDVGDGRHQRACDLLFEECLRREEPGLYDEGLAKSR